MLQPRWSKVLRDLWSQKARTLLIVLSISLGVIGVGMIAQSKIVFIQGMKDNYQLSDPSHIRILSEHFDVEIPQIIQEIHGIKAVEARNTIYGRINPVKTREGPSNPETWKNLNLFGIKDFSKIRMDRIYPQQGAYPAPDGELLLERTALKYLGVHIGDFVWVDFSNGQLRKLRIAGTVADPLRDTADVSGVCYAYISLKSLDQLGIQEDCNTLSIKVERNEKDVKYLNNLAVEIRDKLNQYGIKVFSISIPEPGKHWAYDIVTSIALILQTFGILSILLGLSLIINTIFAVMIGQIRQIGVMKVIGATTGTLMKMYVGFVFVLGLLALLVGVPLGALAAKLLTQKSMNLLSFDSSGYSLSPLVIGLQTGVGLFVPLLAALVPIFLGSRISEREAINGLGFGKVFGDSWVDKLLERVRLLPRPLTLSLRNTFRQKGRLLLTIFTLSIGGAIVISVFSVYNSIQRSIDDSLNYSNYDFRFTFPYPQQKENIEQLALHVPGVKKVESWYSRMAIRQRPDGTKSQDLALLAPLDNSSLIQPTIAKGRWLHPGENHEIVLNTSLLRQESDINVGDELILKINSMDESPWRVVGFAIAPSDVDGFVNYSSLTHVLDSTGWASMLNVKTNQTDHDAQVKIATELKKNLESKGAKLNSPSMTYDIRKIQESRYGIILILLAIMACLLVIVASLGLMGTMSLNVLERTREIGIMRSIGASNRMIGTIVIFEGMIIALISWSFAVLLSPIISRQLCREVGQTLFGAPLTYIFPLTGAWIWLGSVIFLSCLASFFPAWKASRISVKDVLNFE